MALKSKHPLSTNEELARRSGWKKEEFDEHDEYQADKESYWLYVPESCRQTPRTSSGLLVFIDADDFPFFPPDTWRDILDRHRYLWASVNNAGNDRSSAVRMHLSMDVAQAMSSSYSIDRRRTFVAGMSGGAKSASRVALLYPEVFSGVLAICGAIYARDLEAGGYQVKASVPYSLLSTASRQSCYVLLTGENDFNRGEITAIHSMMKQDGFRRASLAVMQGLGHQMPSPQSFERALETLEKPYG